MTGRRVIIGEDDDGIVAVAKSILVDGPHDVFVQVAAVPLRVRGGDHSVADELIDNVVDRHMGLLLGSESNESELTLTGKVDPRNHASRALCERLGADVVESDSAAELDLWVARFRTPDPE